MIQNLFKVLALSGSHSVEDSLIVTKKGVTSALFTAPDESVAIKATFKNSTLPEGEIGIQKLSVINKFLNENLDVTTSLKDNRLIFKAGNKQLKSLTKDPDWVSSKISEEKYEAVLKTTENAKAVTVSIRNLKKIKAYLDTIRTDNFELTFDNNQILLNVGNDKTDIITDDIEILDSNLTKEVTLKLGVAFLDVINSIENFVTVGIYITDETTPIKLVTSNEISEVEVLIAIYG